MQVYKAIKYIRLSYTDDKTVESDSVANQRRLIDDYIARHPEIEVVVEKIDDGYSGVLFVEVRTCIHSRRCRVGEGFFRQTRRIFAGILCVFQENSTQYGGKRPVQTAFEVVNTGSKTFLM